MKEDASLMIHAVNEQHILYYTVSKHHNTVYEEAELYEYGIKCVLCDLRGKPLDEKKIDCISSDFNLVCRLIGILSGLQVYPVHLMEIMDDLMSRDVLPEIDNRTTPLLCG